MSGSLLYWGEFGVEGWCILWNRLDGFGGGGNVGDYLIENLEKCVQNIQSTDSILRIAIKYGNKSDKIDRKQKKVKVWYVGMNTWSIIYRLQIKR